MVRLEAEWIPVRPATDSAMMDAMAWVIVEENLHSLFCTKAHIIKLDLIKAHLMCLDSHIHQIIPHFLLVGIDPCHTLLIPVETAICQL